MPLKPLIEDDEIFNIPLENLDIDLEENRSELSTDERLVGLTSLDLQLMTLLVAGQECTDEEIFGQLIINLPDKELVKAVSKQLETLESSRLVKSPMG